MKSYISIWLIPQPSRTLPAILVVFQNPSSLAHLHNLVVIVVSQVGISFQNLNVPSLVATLCLFDS